ncbi:glycerate kinase [Carboxylicivirga sp. A043]|uniref:glycerate kinase n=1 Tax=Carboxylicivirga litoralis TaxID=2816963 RepID=UPI0021CB486B|nr:glycerate kinase [Carboxylicivirga sp. A043]MCU4158031.1 glycerate kinase [Carboxylicivirga sp. A043]
MAKIVIAPDKFKGSLSGLEFCDIVKQGIKKHCPDSEIIKCPLADGGDGTIDALAYYLDGHMEELTVSDPLLRPIKASYLLSTDKQTAFIEMSAASGIRLLKKEELNPLKTSTYGTGELIKDAINKGARHILLGIGGSATNDGGLGMATALGFQFYDIRGKLLRGIGADLEQLHWIDNSNLHPQLKNIKFEVACDVDNPLFGPDGAATVYAPQKGADSRMVKQLDDGLRNYNDIIKQTLNIDLQGIKGAGAAGGLGAGCIAFLNSELKPGIELMKEAADFEEQIKDTDWLITGEGQLDQQTLSGKVINGIMNSLSTQKLAIFCGVNRLTDEELAETPVSYIDEIAPKALNIDDSMANAAKYLEVITEKFAIAHLL